MDKTFELGMGDLALGVIRAVKAGVIDIPFAPSRYNFGKMIKGETCAIVDKTFELGMGDLALGVIRAVKAGVIDIPFAPSRYNFGKMLPARDHEGAVRYLNSARVPLPQELIDFNRGKIEHRAKMEKRKASFQMVIDDVYAISKGRLVGKPK